MCFCSCDPRAPVRNDTFCGGSTQLVLNCVEDFNNAEVLEGIGLTWLEMAPSGLMSSSLTKICKQTKCQGWKHRERFCDWDYSPLQILLVEGQLDVGINRDLEIWEPISLLAFPKNIIVEVLTKILISGVGILI